MAYEEEIMKDVEENGRLTEAQEDILYNIVLRQDELGRQPTNMLLSALKEDEVLMGLVERQFLTYEVFGKASAPRAVCSLYATYKGTRYAGMFADEIEPRRRFDSAGALRNQA